MANRNHDLIAYFDCSTAGVSGDMILAALIDLGADAKKINQVAEFVKDALPGVHSIKFAVTDSFTREIRGKKIDMSIDEELVFEKDETGHPERESSTVLQAILNTLNHFQASEAAKKFATEAFMKIVNSEREVHGLQGEVRLHEASSADTVIDLAGVALALQDLRVFESGKICASPIALGGGDFDFSHGIMGSPAPATIKILSSSGIPVIMGPYGYGELTTPTGASIIATLADPRCKNPSFIIKRVGYGIGQRDLGRRASFVRIIIGEEEAVQEVVQIETDVDDATGEVVGKAIEDLINNGALDAYAIPTIRKKGRTGLLIKVLSDKGHELDMASILMRDTGSLGIRFWDVRRQVAKRQVNKVTVMGKTIRVKLAWDSKGKLISAKPEFDDIKKFSDELNLPPAILSSKATSEALKGYEEESGKDMRDR